MAIASRYWTYAELLAQVEKSCDLEGEIFIQEEEMLGYANEAIDAAERIVKNTYADYFLDKATLTLVEDSNEASLPSKIYAHKIRRITYRNGGEVYTVERVKDWRKFEEYEETQAGGSTSSPLRYFLLNSTAGTPKILFTRAATAAEAAATTTCWFVRQANRLSSDDDVLDIPEAANYVMAYMRFKAYAKEGHPGLGLAVSELNSEEEALKADLADMVPDGDDELQMDTSFYDDMV
jgi:hypothetical protein